MILQILRSAGWIVFVWMVQTSAPAQTSGSLNDESGGNWNGAPWMITSGPGTYPDGGGVATLLEQVNTTPAMLTDLTTLTMNVPITLGGLNFRGGFRWQISSFGAGSLTLSASGATIDTEFPDTDQSRYLIAKAIGGGGAVGLTKIGAGTLTLSGTNTFTGGIHINAGELSIGADSNAGASGAGNGISLDGGILSVTGSSFMTARAVTIGANHALIDSRGTGTATFAGPISGANNLIALVSNGGAAFTADNSLGGSVSFVARTLLASLSGTNGAFRSASAYNFFGALANLDSSSANNNDRLSNTAPINAGNNGALFLIGSSAASTTENVGPLNVAGTFRLVVNANTGNQPSLNFASITRQNNAALFISGTSLGATPAPFVAQITSATDPVPLIGGGGAAGSATISVLPWITGKDTTTGGFDGMRHVTYNMATDRLRPLAVGEYAAFGGGATNNVRLTSSNTAPPNTTVNALLFAPSSAATIFSGPINVTSGSFLYSPTTFLFPDFSTVIAGLNFGAAEGIVQTTSNLKLSGPITGTGGLTISPHGFTVQLTGANTYTGPTNIFEGTLQVSGEIPNDGLTPNPLGLSTTPIILRSGANFQTAAGGAPRPNDRTSSVQAPEGTIDNLRDIVAKSPLSFVTVILDRAREIGIPSLGRYDAPSFEPNIPQPVSIPSAADVTYRGAITLEGSLALTGGTALHPLAMAGPVTGPGALFFFDITEVSGNNSFTGGTFLKPGAIVKIGHDNALGTGVITPQFGFGNTTIEGIGGPRAVPNELALLAAIIFGGSESLTFNGSVNLNGQRIVSVTNTQPTTFNGNVSDGALVKQGTGTLVLNRTAGNSYTGGTVVSAGTLAVNNSTGSGTGSGTNYINTGGTLAGNFALSGHTEIHGTFRPGNSAGTASFGHDLVLFPVQTQMEIASASSADKINVAGLLTLGGPLVVQTIGGYVAQPGDAFDLFDWGTLDASSFNPPTDIDLSAAATAGGATWDISNFLSDGSIFVTTAALQAGNAVSRKTHGAAGTFDIPMPLSGTPGIECRSSSGNHTLVVNFSRNVVSGSAGVTSGVGSVSGSPSFAANRMTVNLSGVANAQKITVTLTNVTDNTAQVLPSAAVDMIFLAGDTTANKSVNASDVSQTKSRSGLIVSAANFRSDVTANGSINASDVSLVKTRSGTAVP
jgi:fibronectin-binding autotransporter adhesin